MDRRQPLLGLVAPLVDMPRWRARATTTARRSCAITRRASLLQLVPPAPVLFGTDFPPGGAAATTSRRFGR